MALSWRKDVAIVLNQIRLMKLLTSGIFKYFLIVIPKTFNKKNYNYQITYFVNLGIPQVLVPPLRTQGFPQILMPPPRTQGLSQVPRLPSYKLVFCCSMPFTVSNW